MSSMKILVIGPEGAGRTALEDTLIRLGHVVMAPESGAHSAPPKCGDVVMLDLRGDDHDWHELTEGLHADERPMMIVSERPRRLMRSLSGRSAGTMVLTGAESDAGYKVALTVCHALRRSAQGRTRAARVAAL